MEIDNDMEENNILNHLNVDNDESIDNFDNLFIYYLEKYKLEYIYFCYNNRKLFSNNKFVTTIFKRYCKHFFFKQFM